MHENNPRYPSPWSVNWYHVRTRKGKRHRALKVKNSATLTVANPLPEQTGELYEADVRNPFGLARGVTQILVTEGKLILLSSQITNKNMIESDAMGTFVHQILSKCVYKWLLIKDELALSIKPLSIKPTLTKCVLLNFRRAFHHLGHALSSSGSQRCKRLAGSEDRK